MCRSTAIFHGANWPGFVYSLLINKSMESSNEPIAVAWPVTVRRSIELLGIFLLGILIYVGNSVIAPLLMAFFISIVLLPVYRFFKRRKFPEVLSIALALLLMLII